MPFDPERSHRLFALRTLWLFLTWHSKEFRDDWLDKTVKARYPTLDFHVTKFLRSNPKPERVEAYFEPVREVVLEAVQARRDTLRFPDHIRRYLEELEAPADYSGTPFNISSWMIRRRLKLDEATLGRLLADIGGFWYVLRADTRAVRSADHGRLEAVRNEEEAATCAVQLNVGVLRVSDLEHSPGALPQFRYETKGRGGQNMRMGGYVFPTAEEILFQGSFEHKSAGQLTWFYTPQTAVGDRSVKHLGLLLGRNSYTQPIAAPVLCVRVPQSTLAGLAPDERMPDPRDVADLHDRHFEELTEQTRRWIGMHRVAELAQAGILTPADLKPLRDLFKDHAVLRV